MAVTPNSFIFPQGVRFCALLIDVNVVANTLKTMYTAGANGSKVVACIMVASSGVVFQTRYGILRGGVLYYLGTTDLPINSGIVNTLPSIDLMSERITPGLPRDVDGQRYIILQPGDLLQAMLTTTPPSGQGVWYNTFGFDF